MLSQERVDVEIARRRESARQWAIGSMALLKAAIDHLENDEEVHQVSGALHEAERNLSAAILHLAKADALETVRHAG